MQPDHDVMHTQHPKTPGFETFPSIAQPGKVPKKNTNTGEKTLEKRAAPAHASAEKRLPAPRISLEKALVR